MEGVTSGSVFVRIHSSTTDYPRWRSANSNTETEALKDIYRDRKVTGD